MKFNSNIFEIKSNPILQYLGRFVCLFWIIFSFSKYDLNPAFFAITSFLAFIIFISITRRVISLNNRELIVRKNRIIPLMSTITKFPLSEISKIIVEKAKFTWKTFTLGAIILQYFGSPNSSSYISIKLRNENWRYFLILISKELYLEFVKIVKKKIDENKIVKVTYS